MVENGPANTRDQHRIVVGPWSHMMTELHRDLGPIDYGPEAAENWVNLITRWYDWQLKDMDNGYADEAPVRLFVLNEGRWRTENEWPLARTQYRELLLGSDGKANTPRGDGSLTFDQPADSQPDKYSYDPRDPVMSVMDIDAQATPRNQAVLDGRNDVLVYQTAPFEQELRLIGPVTLKLWAASDAVDTDFTAKLVIVHEDGVAVNLTYGIMGAQFRDGYDTPSLIDPNTPYEYTVKLNPVGVLFKPGQRLRLDVSSSDFPNFDRNHNTGKDYWSDGELRTANQTVFHEGGMPSRLIVPVVED
jgi:putative CocE/NonD family hydrolase